MYYHNIDGQIASRSFHVHLVSCIFLLHLKQKWDAIHIGLVNNDSATISIATVNTTLHLDCVRLLNFKEQIKYMYH